MIPAYFARQNPQFKAENYAVPAFNAHQSLNLFIERYIEGFRPDVVVFYDGVNEVWSKCRGELSSFTHVREREIRAYLQDRNENLILNMFALMIDLAGRLKRKFANTDDGQRGKHYDCHTDPIKAEQIARNLLVDWAIVKNLVESYGGKFIGVLQPQAFESAAPTSHINLDQNLGRQYETIYPIIPELLASDFPFLSENFVDLRRSLDGAEEFYIDWCHLSPSGNEIIATWIGQNM